MPWLHLIAMAAVSAEGVSPASNATSDIVGYLLGFGPLGVAVVLFGMGYIVPKPILSAARADAEKWRKAYEDERTAHTATRESLAVASDRAEAAVEAARVTSKLLEVVEQRRDA